MTVDKTILKREEAAVFALRELYCRYGYTPYRMSKFEAYEFYLQNKEFLVSDRIITFHDTDGELMALKPDVTLSIVKNGTDAPGCIQRSYYNENVYRVSGSSHQFREIMQTGLECIGDLDFYEIYEVILLAARSLACIAEEYVLDVSHLGMLGAILDETGADESFRQQAARISQMISLQANVERVVGLIDEKPTVQDSPEVEAKYGDCFHPKRENWEEMRGEIDFDDVSFTYPDGGEEVLTHFSLHVPAGSTVAIVGETGAGKSTLVNLVCRFFEPTGGRVLIDGRDARERSQLWLHSHVGYVLQSPHLFSGTIRENIRYGRPEATDEEVYAAARAVSADRVAAKLEQGYDTDVGECGDKLSTGEKQLISFARAVIARPKIFVLDEATSSVDTETEMLIQKATHTLMQGTTSFVIAHRLSTIRQADVILVIDHGKIVEQGTHERLLKAGGAYAALYHTQLSRQE